MTVSSASSTSTSQFSVDGLVSGLNTTSLITSLMQIEAQPQTDLKNSLSVVQTKISALQGINTSLTSLQKAAEAIMKTTAWQGLAVTSSSPSVTATGSTSVSTGAVTFDVLSTANNHVVATDTINGLTTSVGTSAGLDITVGTGTPTHVDLTDTSLSGVVAAINAHPESGVVAQAVQVSSGVYRLQLTGTGTGAASAFTVSGLSVASAVVTQASDASISVGTGPGRYTASSSTNTFAGVIPGVSFTVSTPTTGVTLSTGRNPSAIATAVQAMITAVNASKATIGGQTAVAAGGTSAGPLTGDSTIRGVDNKLSNAGASVLTNGTALSSYGVQLDSSGNYTFDQAAFLAAYNADPAKAQAGITELATRFDSVTKAATDTTTGSVSLEIQNLNTTVRDLTTHISDWDTRLADKQAALKATFSAMEVSLSTLKNQSNWLTSQLANLPTISSK